MTADPVEFTKETKELAFQVKTTKDTPVGSHKSLFCQVTITQNGEPIVGTVGDDRAASERAAGRRAGTGPDGRSRNTRAAARRPPSHFRDLEQLRAKVLQPEEKKP